MGYSNKNILVKLSLVTVAVLGAGVLSSCGKAEDAQTLISDSFALDALRTSLRGRRVELEEAPSHSLRRSSESTADFLSRVT